MFHAVLTCNQENRTDVKTEKWYPSSICWYLLLRHYISYFLDFASGTRMVQMKSHQWIMLFSFLKRMVNSIWTFW